MQFENKLIHFFATMGEQLKKNKSIIAKEICDAILAVENMPWSAKQSANPSNIKFFNTLFEDKSDLVQRFANFADQLHWRQAGFGKLPENISHEISVTEFIGPNGIFENPNVRIGLLLQSPEIHYPRHWHTAEELYYIISGTAKWATDDEKEKPHQPGNFVHHISGQTHSMTTYSEPLLALWGWTGDIDGASYSI
jgi:mannose-6-phosphate isomerase-like protein (cupin superfamily)